VEIIEVDSARLAHLLRQQEGHFLDFMRIPAYPATHFGSIRPPEPVIPAALESEVAKRPTSGLLNP
jgi:hypothetical protein